MTTSNIGSSETIASWRTMSRTISDKQDSDSDCSFTIPTSGGHYTKTALYSHGSDEQDIENLDYPQAQQTTSYVRGTMPALDKQPRITLPPGFLQPRRTQRNNVKLTIIFFSAMQSIRHRTMPLLATQPLLAS